MRYAIISKIYNPLELNLKNLDYLLCETKREALKLRNFILKNVFKSDSNVYLCIPKIT